MNRIGLALALVFGFASSSLANPPSDALIDGSNVFVNNSCSGTIVATNFILTANHCVADQYDIVEKEHIDKDGKVTKEKIRVAKPGTVSQITFNTNGTEILRKSYVFKLVDTDNRADLALLRTEATVPVSDDMKMACKTPGRGGGVWAVGNSFGILYSTLTHGNIASLDRSYRDLRIAGDEGDLTDDGDHGLVQHSAPIAPGNSGGALYNESGEFIGVNVRGIPGGFSFSVPLSDVSTFLSKNGLGRLWHCD